jgi:RNA recognition motif-containing protein
VSWQTLKDMFKPFGNVTYADVATQGGQQGARSQGWGRVKFASAGGRGRAIQSMNGANCQGRNLEVRMDAKENGDGNSGNNNRSAPTGHACYVGNLPWSVRWQDLKDLFKSFGDVTNAEIATEGGVQGGRSHGWGIVHFVRTADRDQAINQLNGTDWDGRTIEVRIDQKSQQQPHQQQQKQRASQNNNSNQNHNNGGNRGSSGSHNNGTEYGVYVGNLPWTCDWKMLKDTFSSQFNDVIYADVATEGGARNGRSKGWGTVKFSSAKSRDQAIARYDGANMSGRNIEVRVDQKQ